MHFEDVRVTPPSKPNQPGFQTPACLATSMEFAIDIAEVSGARRRARQQPGAPVTSGTLLFGRRCRQCLHLPFIIFCLWLA